MKHLWLDPGETTGWAYFEDATPLKMGELLYPNELFTFLRNLRSWHINIFGYENYRLRPKGMKAGWTPTWDEVIPIRVIGAIENTAFLCLGSVESVVSQDPSIKPVGYAYAGLPPYNPNKRNSHMQDAVAHGAYYWMETHCAVNRKPRNPQSGGFQGPSRFRVARKNN